MRPHRFEPHPGLALVMIGLMLALAIAAAVSLGALVVVARGEEPSACEAPVAGNEATITRCHEGYVSVYDMRAKVPRLVAYRLTGPHTLGCASRVGLGFKVDALAPAADQARPSDYRGSGYDLGHMAPNEDFAWSAQEQRDSFSMLNVAPQVPGLNRQNWERLEETVRAWALERGTVDVYVGSVIGPDDQSIGSDHVDVPVAFWKLVHDPAKQQAIAFEMPNKSIAKGDLTPYEVSIADIEKIIGAELPLGPGMGDDTIVPPLWPADLGAWRKAHNAACNR